MEEKIKKEGKGIEKGIRKLINNENVLIGAVIVLVFLIILLSLKPTLINGLKGDGKYNIELIKIEGCDKCFDLSLVANLVSEIENINIKEKSLSYNSAEAKTLIAKYNIEKIPALIIKGKVDKLNLDTSIFDVGKGAAVFDKPVPYIDLASNKVNGLIDLIEVYDSKCLDCSSLSNIKASLEKTGFKVNNYEKVEISSKKGKELAEKNDLTFLPSLLISNNLKDYWWIFPRIENMFLEKEDYIFKEPVAPYLDLKTGGIKGKVTITYITNKSCTECYNATLLKDLFAGIGIYIDKEKYADVSASEGKSLLVKYNITAIPTAVLSKEILDYNLKSILDKVGKFEDNEFILTNLDSLKIKYQKLNSIGG